ncbi:MAG: alkaline phosphatase family protein [Acidobacteriota bacterium]|nr:alkaline phosphatase family protein [Acidobacteriota bacterium]
MREFLQQLKRFKSGRLAAAVGLIATVTCFSSLSITAQTLPRPDHVVIVVEENHSFGQIIGESEAPYLNSLLEEGTLLTSFFALHHPSQPNYIVLFSGDRYGITNNTCVANRPLIHARSLGGQLVRNGLSFKGYAEDLPKTGSMVCFSDKYVRRHAPWTNFGDVPTVVSLPFSEFPNDFTKLPTVAFVIPNLDHDMHDGLIGTRRKEGDDWLRNHLNEYKEWAKTHNSLLIVTWDEDDQTFFFPRKITRPPANRVAAIFVGEMVKPNFKSDKQYDHVDLLKTILEMYRLPPLPAPAYAKAKVIDDIWK